MRKDDYAMSAKVVIIPYVDKQQLKENNNIMEEFSFAKNNARVEFLLVEDTLPGHKIKLQSV